MSLTDEQLQRYRRQLILAEIGEQGQAAFRDAAVFVIGAGGLGSSVGYWLTGAGVGKIALADPDIVELSNLHRQIAHSTQSLGMPKVVSAKKTFQALNPDVELIPINTRLRRENIDEYLQGYDVIVDCSDNFETRFMANAASVRLRKPLVTGAVFKFEGQLTVIRPFEGPCYQCLFEAPPPVETGEEGLLGVIPGVIGALQAAEVLKLISGAGNVLTGALLIYDGLSASFRKINIPKNPRCPVCGMPYKT